MIKPKRTAAEQVEDEAARRALNPTLSRQTISDHQAEPEFQENHKRLKADRLGGVDTYRIHKMMAARVTTAW